MINLLLLYKIWVAIMFAMFHGFLIQSSQSSKFAKAQGCEEISRNDSSNILEQKSHLRLRMASIFSTIFNIIGVQLNTRLH